MDRHTMRIGEAALSAGVNIRTLHYYERRGLLPPPARTAANYRLYRPEDVRRIRFIKRAQELGFTLEEIKELLDLSLDPSCTCGEVRDRTLVKIADIKAKIGSLRSMQKALENLVSACSGRGSVAECPILESLDRNRILRPVP